MNGGPALLPSPRSSLIRQVRHAKSSELPCPWPSAGRDIPVNIACARRRDRANPQRQPHIAFSMMQHTCSARTLRGDRLVAQSHFRGEIIVLRGTASVNSEFRGGRAGLADFRSFFRISAIVQHQGTESIQSLMEYVSHTEAHMRAQTCPLKNGASAKRRGRRRTQ